MEGAERSAGFIYEEEIEIRLEVQFQCPECQHLLKRSGEVNLCPLGHVRLFTTAEGYPILKGKGRISKQLICGGEFRDGVLWQKALSHYRKAVYVVSPKDKGFELGSLHDCFADLKCEFRVVPLDRLNRLHIDRETMIVFSHHLGKKDAGKIIFRYFRHPVYRYIPGVVMRMGFLKLIKQALGATLYKILLAPITSRLLEVRYEGYLSDGRIAKQFAQTYLPQEMHIGKGRHAFDIGCGRGRHVAILNQLGFTVTGMDIQKHPYWRKLSKANLIVGSVECLSYFPDTIFDFIVCMQLLMYLDDDAGALAHIRRMLKKDGYLLLQVTNKENLHTLLTKRPLTQDPYLQRYYSESELCSKLGRNGFKVDRVWTEKVYTPFLVLPGNILYEFVLNRSLKKALDRLINPRYLGLINILARAS